MTPTEWKDICDGVTEEMRSYTRPFATPLSTSSDKDVRLVGSGSYVSINETRILVTCEHVATTTPMEYRFCGSASVFRHPGQFTIAPDPVDAAFAPITDKMWEYKQHSAGTIPYHRFALRHSVIDQAELLFFLGFAGENAHYGFGVHETNCTGYCSQEKIVKKADTQIFEIFWEPDKIEFVQKTSAEALSSIRHDDPRGLSGSLVWNTRYLEVTRAGNKWRPQYAVVTGLLRRYDPDTKTLLALRVEHLRKWLEKHIPS